MIKKNYIFPPDKYPQESNYTGSYRNNSDSRVKTEKVNYKDNDVLPRGNFDGHS
jgi:hypothetical protein